MTETQFRPSSTNGTGYNDKHVKWLLKALEKMLSSCLTQPVTLCSPLANSASFLIHPPVEPNEQEKQKSNFSYRCIPFCYYSRAIFQKPLWLILHRWDGSTFA